MAALLSPADLPRSAPGGNKARDSSAGVGGDERGQVAQAGPASASMVTAKEKEAATTGAARQQHGSIGIHAGRGGVAPPAGVSGGPTGEADDDHDRDHIQSPLAPTSPLCPAAGVGGVVGPGAGAGDGSATTSSSLRPYSRGLVARSFSGNLQHHQNQHHQHQRQQRAQQEKWQREERAASLGDRYKGNSVFRHHHQQQHHGGSTTGNRYPSRRQGPAGGEGTRGVSVAGSSDGTSSRPRKHSAAAGAGGDVGAAAASGNRRRSTGRTGRRDTNRDRDQDRGWEAKGEEGGGGAGGEGQQQGNGRVAQIAESESCQALKRVGCGREGERERVSRAVRCPTGCGFSW